MVGESGLPSSSDTGAAEEGHDKLAADDVRSQGSAKDTVLIEGHPTPMDGPALSDISGRTFFKAKGLVSMADVRNQYLSVLLRLEKATSSDFKLLVSCATMSSKQFALNLFPWNEFVPRA